MSFLQRRDGNKREEDKQSPEGKVLASIKNLNLRPNTEGTEIRASDGTQVGPAATTSSAEDLLEMIPNLSKGLRKFAIVPLPTTSNTGWISRHTGDVYIGQQDFGQICVVGKERRLKESASLGPDYGDITSGYELLNGNHLIVVHNKQTKRDHLINITIGDNKIVTNKQIDTAGPRTIFQYDDNHVGLFCLYPERVEVYSKSDLQLSQTVLLDIKVSGSSKLDICKTGDYFCISESDAGAVHVVDDTGEHVQTLGQTTETAYQNQAGKLFKPMRILYDVDGGLVVSCRDGSYHRYDSGQWTITVQSKDIDDYLYHCMVTDNRVYTMYQNQLSMFKIKT